MLELPWSTVRADLFQYKNFQFPVLVDYNSGVIEYSKLPDTKGQTVINHSKSQFVRHGIPVKLVTDNGLQFSSRLFKEFASIWQFEHRTSSPTDLQSNDISERTDGILKSLLVKADKPYLAILDYRIHLD